MKSMKWLFVLVGFGCLVFSCFVLLEFGCFVLLDFNQGEVFVMSVSAILAAFLARYFQRQGVFGSAAFFAAVFTISIFATGMIVSWLGVSGTRYGMAPYLVVCIPLFITVWVACTRISWVEPNKIGLVLIFGKPEIVMSGKPFFLVPFASFTSIPRIQNLVVLGVKLTCIQKGTLGKEAPVAGSVLIVSAQITLAIENGIKYWECVGPRALGSEELRRIESQFRQVLMAETNESGVDELYRKLSMSPEFISEAVGQQVKALGLSVVDIKFMDLRLSQHMEDRLEAADAAKLEAQRQRELNAVEKDRLAARGAGLAEMAAQLKTQVSPEAAETIVLGEVMTEAGTTIVGQHPIESAMRASKRGQKPQGGLSNEPDSYDIHDPRE